MNIVKLLKPKQRVVKLRRRLLPSLVQDYGDFCVMGTEPQAHPGGEWLYVRLPGAPDSSFACRVSRYTETFKEAGYVGLIYVHMLSGPNDSISVSGQWLGYDRNWRITDGHLYSK